MRKLFGTDGIRGKANAYPIDTETVMKLGKAASIVLKKKTKRPIFVIGKDPRLSSYMLEYALTAGILSTGADVYLVGPLPTPAVAHLTKSFAADAGIMISASHNPATDNGIKFFDSTGYKLPDDVEEKIEITMDNGLEKFNVEPEKLGKAHRIEYAWGRYIEYAKSTIKNLSLKGLKIALDCSNGGSFKVAPKIFRELGADLVVLNNKPDGLNINKDAGATHPEIVKVAVLAHQCDIGITLDGDADRIIAVDEKGEILDGDDIISIAANYLMKNNKLKSKTVVVTGYSNLALDKFMGANNGNVVRTKNGDRHVIESMRNNGYNLGGEQSGHIIFSDYSTTGDGTISALQLLRILVESKKKVSELRVLNKFPQTLRNIGVETKTPIEELEVSKLIDKIEAELGDSGRVLVRYSGTQDLARVMVECENPNLVEKYADEISKAIKKEVG